MNELHFFHIVPMILPKILLTDCIKLQWGINKGYILEVGYHLELDHLHALIENRKLVAHSCTQLQLGLFH